MRASKATIIMVIILIFFSTPIPHYLNNVSEGKIGNASLKITPTKKTITILQTGTAEYLGKYIRSKDYVTLNGTLSDPETGDPLPGAKIDLYLDDGDGILKKTEDLFLASNTTDSEGHFYFRILVSPDFREGNNTLIAHFDGDYINGQYYGPADEYYVLTVYVQAKVGIAFSSKKLALFEENVSCDVWIYSDNGTVLSIENLTIYMSVYFSNETDSFKLLEQQLITGSDGHNRTIISFSSVGNYTVYLLFNITENKDLLGEFIVSEQQYLDNGTLKGNDTSSVSDKFEVYKAVKIILWFNDDQDLKQIDVYRNNTRIKISGLFYNITGQLDSQKIIIHLYDAKTGTTYYYYVNATNGEFSKELLISPDNITVGSYLLYATDTDDSTVDLADNLLLVVKSKLQIQLDDINEITGKSFPAGSVIGISGKVIDVFSLEGVPNVTIKTFFEDLSNESITDNVTQNAGIFFIKIPIPDPVPNDTLKIKLVTYDTPLYDPSSATFSLKVFNLILINITINESFYSWGISHGSLQMLTESDEYVSEENETLGIKIEVYDDFGNSHEAEIKILAGNTTIYTVTGDTIRKTIKVNSSSFYLRFQIFIPDINDQLEVAILVKVRPRGGISPTSIIIPVIILTIIGAIIAVSVLAERKESEAKIAVTRGKIESAKLLLHEIEDSLNMEDYYSAIAKGGRLLLQIAKELKGSYPIWMTTREIANYILEEFSHPIKETVKNALMDLVLVYEKVVYGHKKPSKRDIKRYKEAIKVIRTYVIPKIEGATRGESVAH